MSTEFVYRRRCWNRFDTSGRGPHTDEQIEAGWDDWEFISEQKYNDILSAIRNGNCHYQAQKLELKVVADESFDPRAYLASLSRPS